MNLLFGPLRDSEVHPICAAGIQNDLDRCRVAVAFATESGVKYFRELLASTDFDAARKEWLIGLENGFTQPAAIRELMGLSDSVVCLFDLEGMLEGNSMSGTKFFHPKLYEFASLSSRSATLVSSSANLTEGGLKKNIEQYLLWSGSLDDDVASKMATWWDSLWRTDWIASDDSVALYEQRRPSIQTHRRRGPESDRPSPIEELEPSAAELKSASEMWIEAVRPLEGGSRNQLELMLNAHMFFFPDVEDPPRDAPKRLYFEDEAGAVYDNPQRSVRFNGPPLRPEGNGMWRVYLPTAHEGLSGYQGGNALLRFVRTQIPDQYYVSIIPSGSPDADALYDGSTKVAGVKGPPTRLMGWIV